MSLLRRARAILCLGGIAWEAMLRHLLRRGLAIPRPRPRFAHAATARIEGAPVLLGSYHVSQQNTQTGRLTPAMMDGVLRDVRNLLGSENS